MAPLFVFFLLFYHNIFGVQAQSLSISEFSCLTLFDAEIAAGVGAEDQCTSCRNFFFCESEIGPMATNRLASAPNCCFNGVTGACEQQQQTCPANPVPRPPALPAGALPGGARCPYVVPGSPRASFANDPIVFIASQNFERSSFQVEQNGLVRVPAGGTSAEARTAFGGPAGLYLLEIRMQQEDDGSPSYRIGTTSNLSSRQVNWLGDPVMLPSRALNEGRFCCVSWTWGPFRLSPGQILVVEGRANNNQAWARWQSLTLMECVVPPPPTVAPVPPTVAPVPAVMPVAPPTPAPTRVPLTTDMPSLPGAPTTTGASNSDYSDGSLALILSLAAILLCCIAGGWCFWCYCRTPARGRRSASQAAAGAAQTPYPKNATSGDTAKMGSDSGPASRSGGPLAAPRRRSSRSGSLSRSGSVSRLGADGKSNETATPGGGSHRSDGSGSSGVAGADKHHRSRRHSRLQHLVHGGGAGAAYRMNPSPYKAAPIDGAPLSRRSHTQRLRTSNYGSNTQYQSVAPLSPGTGAGQRRSYRTSKRASATVGVARPQYMQVPQLPADQQRTSGRSLASPGPSLINRQYDRVGDIFKDDIDADAAANSSDDASSLPPPPPPDDEGSDEIQYEDVTKALATLHLP